MTLAEYELDSVSINEVSAPCLCLSVDINHPDVVTAIDGSAITDSRARFASVLFRTGSTMLGVEYFRFASGACGEHQEMHRQLAEYVLQRQSGDAAWPAVHETAMSERSDGDQTSSSLAPPSVTVVICTYRRPEGLRLTLESLIETSGVDFETLVVDNAPDDTSVIELLGEFPDRVRYVAEPQRGLSHARNRALSVVDTDLVAWIDDDEIVDKFWLQELLRGFEEHPNAVGLSGLMLPATLQSEAALLFEQYGGHNKHRGTQPQVFSPATRPTFNPLYPLPPFGTGGNMTFRTEALRAVGGFDVHLGAGSACKGAEDTLVFTKLLEAENTVVYWPNALTYHFHRSTFSQLRKQMFGYGVGLTAFYTALVADNPRRIGKLFELVPSVLRDFGRKDDSLRKGHLAAAYPRELKRANMIGIVQGPVRYLWARAAQGRHM